MLNLKKLILASGAGALLAVTALTGCETNHDNDRTAGRTLDDKIITGKVEDKLKEEPVYKFTGVDVRTYGGVVQLSGFVDTEEQKRRAGELAQTVEGVTQVMNNIALKPNGLTPTGRPGESPTPTPVR